MTIHPRALRIMLWTAVGLLCVMGLWMIASTTVVGIATGTRDHSLTFRYLIVQAGGMIAGIVAAIIIATIGLKRLMTTPMALAALGTAMLGLVAVLAVGRTVNGAKRWIDLGPINIQPAEIAKLALVVWLAWWYRQIAERARALHDGVLVPTAVFGAIAMLVYLTKDLGSVIVMLVALVMIMFMARARVLTFLGMVGLVAPLLIYEAVLKVGYRRDRLLAFLDPWNHDGPAAYHLQQGAIAIADGGLTGVGLGRGDTQLGMLPERHTDFIFAVICNEWGMLGALAIGFIYLGLVWTGLAIAQRARDTAHRLLAVGAVAVLGTQAFWNMLVVTGTVPTKGLTLPFISYGGTSVAVCMVFIGILDAVAAAEEPHAIPQTPRASGTTSRVARHSIRVQTDVGANA